MKKLKEILQYKRVLGSVNFSLLDSEDKRKVLHKKKNSIKNLLGILYVKSSFSNNCVCLLNLKGKVIFFKTSGSLGFKGKKKRNTKFSIESTLNNVLSRLNDSGFSKIFLFFNGFAKIRYSMIKFLKENHVNVVGIRDLTPMPHNGCRPRKLRRG